MHKVHVVVYMYYKVSEIVTQLCIYTYIVGTSIYIL